MITHSPTSDQAGPSPNTVFDLLANHRRHAILDYLRTNGGEAEVRELVVHVALSETRGDDTSVSAETYKRVYTALYHNHLPRLAEADVIDYDMAEERVARGQHAETVDRYLTVV